jgi:AcrR family transcriptional regulator
VARVRRKRRKNPFFVLEGDPESKREILKAALELFVHHGPSEPTVRQIAARAGYSNPVIFKYFPTKDKLALYLFKQCWQRISDAFRDASLPGRSFREDLEAFLRAYARIMEEDLDAFIYARENIRRFCRFLSPELQQQNLGALLSQIFDKGKMEGGVASDVDIEMLVTGVVGLLSQFASLLYWREFRGSKDDWLHSMKRTIMKMST